MSKYKNIGGLWVKESANGGKFMSGTIEINHQKLNISVFKNDVKDNPKRPAYQVSVDEEKLNEFVRLIGGTTESKDNFEEISDFDDSLPF